MKKLFMFLAIAGVFAACKPEEIETAFEVRPAQATIEVSVIDVNTLQAAEGYTLTASAGTVNGNIVTLEGNKALAETTVTLTVAYMGADYSGQVKVNALRAGGNASYSTTIIVGVPETEAVITIESSEPVESSAKFYIDPDPYSHYGHTTAHYSYNGIDTWVENLTEFMLNGVCDYTVMKGSKVDFASVDHVDTEYSSVVDSYATGLNNYSEYAAKFEFTVSAWAYYTVEQTVTYSDYVVSILADGVVVGEIPVRNVATSIQYIEIANPLGHGHYHYGHGDPHGDNANAGGGIVYGE